MAVHAKCVSKACVPEARPGLVASGRARHLRQSADSRVLRSDAVGIQRRVVAVVRGDAGKETASADRPRNLACPDSVSDTRLTKNAAGISFKCKTSLYPVLPLRV